MEIEDLVFPMRKRILHLDFYDVGCTPLYFIGREVLVVSIRCNFESEPYGFCYIYDGDDHQELFKTLSDEDEHVRDLIRTRYKWYAPFQCFGDIHSNCLPDRKDPKVLRRLM